MSPEERFWGKVEKTDGCWDWTASCNTYGYPMFWDGRATVPALTWLLGHLPRGQHRHHVCKNRRCVRLDHLRVLTSAQHVRTHAAERETCPQGHPYTRVIVRNNGRRQRVCQTCVSDATRRWRRRKERV